MTTPGGETENDTKHLVLMFNVGPNIFIDLSYICQKSVRKLSVPKICLKTV